MKNKNIYCKNEWGFALKKSRMFILVLLILIIIPISYANDNVTSDD